MLLSFAQSSRYACKPSSDHYLDSAQKRAFQAIVSDSSTERLLRDLGGIRRAHEPLGWEQALPNQSNVVSLARDPQRMHGLGGSVDARGGLSLRFYAMGSAHGYVHLDIVVRRREEATHSLLSLDDLYNLLLIPGASLRDEIAPVVTAVLSGSDKPVVVAQSVVALPTKHNFTPYVDLSFWAGGRVPGATGPTAVHWSATSWDQIASKYAWKQTVLRMIDRLFSDGSYLDYEPAIHRLATSAESS